MKERWPCLPCFLEKAFLAQDSLTVLPEGAVCGLGVIRQKWPQAADLGWDWRRKRPLPGVGAPLPSPPRNSMRCGVVTCWAQRACGDLQVWDPSLDLGSRARVLGGGGVAGGQTPDFPHSCLPALPFLCPTSSPLCSMTLFVCLQVPQAEEAPMGRDWSRRMSVEGRLPALPVYPHPNPLPWGLLDTPPHSLHPRIPEVQGSEGPTTNPGLYRPLPVTSCKELILGVQGRKGNTPLRARAHWLKFCHQCLSP